MPGFYNWGDLLDYIQLQFTESLKEVVSELTEHVRYELDKNWYSIASVDSLYERTYQLLESITWRNSSHQRPTQGKSELEFEIFYDESKIIPMDGTDDKPWSPHKSMFDGEGYSAGDDFVRGLTEVMEYGNPSSILGWSESEAPKPFTRTLQWEASKKYVMNEILKRLRSKGFAAYEGEAHRSTRE